MNRMIHIALLLAAGAGLSACATPEPADNQRVAAASSEKLDASTLTGSRIPSKKTGQMVSAIGGKEYEQNQRNQPNPFEAR